MHDLQLSKRGALVVISKEGVALSTYRDIVGVKTWGIGITSMSGHNVDRYIGEPSTMERALEVYLWALKRYEADVIDAFAPKRLNEHQLAAAVSFHYNTGAIHKATWVKKFKAGDITGARKSFMSWRKPAAIIWRRTAERDLFFVAKWPNYGSVLQYDVTANMQLGRGRSVNITSALDAIWEQGISTVEKVVADAAAEKRISTTEIATGLTTVTGLTGIGNKVAQTANEAKSITQTLIDAGPWVLLGLVVVGAGLYIWRERSRKKKLARAAL